MQRWLSGTSTLKLINGITLAATLVVAGACLMVVWSISEGTGGTYWGYESTVSPVAAAREAMARGDYRFLAFQLGDVSGADGWPNASECDGHPLGPGLHLRMNHIDAQHGAKSAQLAHGFAAAFNARVHIALEMRHGATCAGAVALN